jgi:hypothetical protein
MTTSKEITSSATTLTIAVTVVTFAQITFTALTWFNYC